MDGVLVIDKPAGMTSHDVVDEVRRRLATKKVGHGGTLDPDATGVLVVGVGRATRLLRYAQGAPKTYRATARLGLVTTTQDASGEVVERRSARHVRREEVESALEAFVGDIQQMPPMVSAVKVGGERLYRKARRGEEVARSARKVRVYDLRLLEVAGGEYPDVTFEVACSAGTYVRTLAADLGERLRCGAHLVALRRTAAGSFTERDAVSLDEVDASVLRPVSDLVGGLPRLHVDEDTARAVAHGRPIGGGEGLERGEEVALFLGDRLLGVYRAEDSRLVPDMVVAAK